MNDEELSELLRLHDEATPGPWQIMTETRRDHMGFFWPLSSIENAEGDEITNDITNDDAAYIVAACNAVPKLVQRIRELEAQKI